MTMFCFWQHLLSVNSFQFNLKLQKELTNGPNWICGRTFSLFSNIVSYSVFVIVVCISARGSALEILQ